jgi:hypothetical protein
LSSRLVEIVLRKSNRRAAGDWNTAGVKGKRRRRARLDGTEQDCRRSKGRERRTEKLSRSSHFRLALNSIILNPKSNNLGIKCHQVPINPRRHHLRCHLGRAMVHLIRPFSLPNSRARNIVEHPQTLARKRQIVHKIIGID